MLPEAQKDFDLYYAMVRGEFLGGDPPELSLDEANELMRKNLALVAWAHEENTCPHSCAGIVRYREHREALRLFDAWSKRPLRSVEPALAKA